MDFFVLAVNVLQILVMAVGRTWSLGAMAEGYGNENPGANAHVRKEARTKTRDRPPALHYSEPKTKDSIVGKI